MENLQLFDFTLDEGDLEAISPKKTPVTVWRFKPEFLPRQATDSRSGKLPRQAKDSLHAKRSKQWCPFVIEILNC